MGSVAMCAANTRLTRLRAVLGACSVALGACSTSESILFEHGPSERFYGKPNFDDRELRPYRSGNVVVLATLKERLHGVYTLWISTCNASGDGGPRPVAARLSIGTRSVQMPTDRLAAPPRVLDDSARGLHCRQGSLMDLSVDELLPAGVTSPPRLKFDVEVAEGEAKPTAMSFVFVVRRIRRAVFPT